MGSRECRCLGGLGYPRILGSVEALRGVWGHRGLDDVRVLWDVQH